MDKAKMRLFAGVAGGLCGLCGLVTLAVAGALALSSLIGPIYATLVLGLTFVLLAVVCIVFFLLPGKTIEEEIEQAEELGSEMLADLPIDTAKHFVKKHPVAATAVALFAGYLVIKNPQSLARQAQLALMSLL